MVQEGFGVVEDEMKWDLSQLVESTDPVSVQKRLKVVVAEAEEIRDRYHDKIKELDADGLLRLLEDRDAYTLRSDGVDNYCNLMYSADSTNDVAKQLNDAYRSAAMKAGQILTFIDIELGRLLAQNPSLVKNPKLAEYRHYLERILRRVPHMLSEAEESLTIMKDRNGISAWQMLQSDWLSTKTFDIEIEGEKKTLPYGKIIGLYESQDRDLRKRSNQTVYQNLGKDEIIWASALRAVCTDHLQMCELRKYSTPMAQSLISNDIEQQTVDALMNTIQSSVGLYQRYIALKAKLMHLDKLANYDVMASLPATSGESYGWREAREEVISVYMEFDREIGSWVGEMFEKHHIDSEVRMGKESGAFCARWLSGESAYVLQSYNERIKDVYTLAHELGHAVHDYLVSRLQKPSNCQMGSCLAETASTFGELLLTDRLLSKAKTREEKQAILVHVLDTFGITAFQVSARVLFEKSMYAAVEQGKFLDGENIAKLWMSARDKIYGSSVDWLDVMKWEWTMKPHYYMANYRFYNYPYVFGQLLVFALYQIYKKEGKSFVPKLKRFLASGSSKSPRELAVEMGFDINTEEFWKKGMAQAKEFIDVLESLL